MAERIIKYKIFWAWDFDKEEQWLNEMANSGLVLDEVGFFKYTFVRCEPFEYSIRLEMRAHDERYISFMNETGAEYIGRYFLWQFFRKRNEFGSFDLFSDIDSRLEHLRRIHRVLLFAGIMNLIIGIFNSIHSTFVTILNILMATFLMYGVGRIKGKMEYLEKERQLRE